MPPRTAAMKTETQGRALYGVTRGWALEQSSAAMEAREPSRWQRSTLW